MPTLLNVWREFGSYLRYSNAQNLALLAINGGLWSLVIGAAKPSESSVIKFLIYPPQYGYLIFSVLIAISQMAIFFSLIPSLAGKEYSLTVAACRLLGFMSDQRPVDKRNIFYFLDVSDFSTPNDLHVHTRNVGITSNGDGTTVELALCSQILVVAKICTKKTATFLVALSLTGLGLACMALSFIWR